MRLRYKRWMHDWETRLSTRDNNRVVRPLEWGLEWTQLWPLRNGSGPDQVSNAERALLDWNQRILADSDRFFSYQTPQDFRLESLDGKRGDTQVLRFTSPVETRYPENDVVTARWFPARGDRKSRAAVIVLPQWNSDGESHNGLCRIFSMLGISALRLSLPYHDVRKPGEIERADYAVSSNIGRTIDAARQAVVDVRSCLDWLQAQGHTQFGIVGTSLGSCYAFITAAHEPRLQACAFNHASTYFADVVWTGQSTRHIRLGIENEIELERLRRAWLAISPMSYVDQFQRFTRRSLVVYATYDLTFPPELSRELISEFRRRRLPLDVKVLPCGHYSSGETPYKFLDAWYLARFLRSALGREAKAAM